jgi:lactoylglutathione lyase
MRVSHVIRYVEDLERSIAFYRDVLGIAFRFSEHGYAEFDAGVKLGLYERARLPTLIGTRGQAPGSDGEVLFTVDDVDGWVSRLRDRGVEILSGPEDRPWGQRTLHLLDPDGLVVELAQDIPRQRPRGG